jgi:hypothetical protein
MLLLETTLRLQVLMQLVLSTATRRKRKTAVATSGCTVPVVQLPVLPVAHSSWTSSVSAW